MFIVLAKLIWGFEIRGVGDGEGREVEVDTSDGAFMEGANTVPRPYRARWVVRGSEVRETIEREWEEATGEGYLLRGVRVGVDGVIVR